MLQSNVLERHITFQQFHIALLDLSEIIQIAEISICGLLNVVFCFKRLMCILFLDSNLCNLLL